MVLVKTPESALDSKEIEPVSPQGNQPRVLIGRTDAEAEAPVLWPPDAKRKKWLVEAGGVMAENEGGVTGRVKQEGAWAFFFGTCPLSVSPRQAAQSFSAPNSIPAGLMTSTPEAQGSLLLTTSC